MVTLIEERWSEPLSLHRLAPSLGRQEAYLGRLFRQEMGVTMREYLARVRLERAAGLIRQGEKVEAVAIEVGYRSKKNFYRQFVRRFGTTPAVYRQEASPAADAPPWNEEALASLTFRLVGPAAAGGRITGIAPVERRPSTFYVAAGIGGVWKTTNNGTTWEPVFDHEQGAAVGALAIAPSDPGVLWIGTGDDAGPRRSRGDGVFKSVDGGRTWMRAGLACAHHIHRIVIDPKDPETAYAATAGGSSGLRGLYKTMDGGRTWACVFPAAGEAGVTDVVLDPHDWKRLVVAAGGLYITNDGAVTWRKLSAGLPSSGVGRVGLDACRRDPSIICAVIEHAVGGTFRSDDGGERWRRIGGRAPGDGFKGIRLDPDDPQRVYLLGDRLEISNDGGATFRGDLSEGVGSGHRALWVNPADPQHLIDGNDGGVWVSYDRGATWQAYENLPLGRFCQVGVDLCKPYNIYGALEESGAWGGPSATRHEYGITNDDWFMIPGSGRFAVLDPSDANTVYTLAPDRQLVRCDRRTGDYKIIRPDIDDVGTRTLSEGVGTPIVICSSDPSTLYVAVTRVLKSTDRGASWTPISPDLRGAITALAESPRAPGLLYAGTDDGAVFVCRNGTPGWDDVSGRLPGSATRRGVNRIAASHQESDTAYVALDRDRDDDCSPRALMTRDAGRSWKSIGSNLPRGPVHVLRDDPRNANLLYAGTDVGLFVSIDRGGRWIPLKNNLPTVPISDLIVHPRETDLVLATRGRGLWILDDVTPLQELTEDVLASPAHLFRVRPGVQLILNGRGGRRGDAVFAAPNPPPGTLITYYLKEASVAGVKLLIKDATGALVRELEGNRTAGIHRVAWDLRLAPPRDLRASPPSGSPDPAWLGAFVRPGDYDVALVVNGRFSGTRPVRVEADPFVDLSDAARDLQRRAVTELTEMQNAIGAAAASLEPLGSQMDAVRDRLGRSAIVPAGIRQAAAALAGKVSTLRGRIGSGPQDQETETSAYAGVHGLKAEIVGSTSVPTPLQHHRLQQVRAEVVRCVAELEAVMTADLPTLNRLLDRSGMSPIRVARRRTGAAAGLRHVS
jgi:AraC-like DNA-binding protein/photosystem II stability/assembly factor-like uncharacterized protein